MAAGELQIHPPRSTGPSKVYPRRNSLDGHTATALPRLSAAFGLVGRPGIADMTEVPSWGREQCPPCASSIIIHRRSYGLGGMGPVKWGLGVRFCHSSFPHF